MEDRMTAQKLKNSILQMAVQGKLVPQDPNDEPASVLLERIRKEKEQLIKEGKIKRNKNESFIFRGADNLHYEQIGKDIKCIEDELPFEIPDSWEWVRLNFVGTMVRGSGIKRNEVVEKGYPCIRYGEIYTSYNLFFKDSISHVDGGVYNSSKKIRKNDLIYTLTGENKPDIAKTIAYLGEKDIAAGGDLAVWSNHHMNPLYLSYLLSSPYMISNKVKLATGDIIVHISVDKVGSFLAPIPPLEEQNRIVNQMLILERLIKEYSEKEDELFKLNSNIKEKLKKSILQHAIEGKLVPQDPNDEPASALLERIHEEKQKLIAEGKIKKDKNESVIYRRDNSYYEKLNKIEHCIDNEIPFDLPNNWEISRLKNLVSIFTGKKDANFGDEKGIYNFYTCSNKPIKSKTYSHDGEYLIMPGNGANIGLVTYFYGKFEAYQRTYLLENCFSINLMWLKYHLESNWKEYNNDKMFGSAIPYIKLSNLEEYYVFIPPIEEQDRIVGILKKACSIL